MTPEKFQQNAQNLIQTESPLYAMKDVPQDTLKIGPEHVGKFVKTDLRTTAGPASNTSSTFTSKNHIFQDLSLILTAESPVGIDYTNQALCATEIVA